MFSQFSDYRPGVSAINRANSPGFLGPPTPIGGTGGTGGTGATDPPQPVTTEPPKDPWANPAQPGMDATAGRKRQERLQAWARNGGQRMGRRADGSIDYDRSIYDDNADRTWYSGPQYGPNNLNPNWLAPDRTTGGPAGYRWAGWTPPASGAPPNTTAAAPSPTSSLTPGAFNAAAPNPGHPSQQWPYPPRPGTGGGGGF